MATSQDANMNAFTDKPVGSDPFGHLQANFNSLFAKVINLESSIPQILAVQLDESMPRMVADVFEERILDLLSDTQKNIFPQLIKDSVKQSLPKFDKRVKKTLKAEVPNLILKPLNMEFNALNKMESRRFVHLQKELRKVILTKGGKSVKRNVMKEIWVVCVPKDIMVINANQLQNKIKKNASDILELVELIRELIRLIELVADKGKGKAQVSDDDQLKQLIPFMDEEGSAAELAAYEAKRAKMLKEYNHCISFRDDPLPITKISYRVNNSTKEATMRITRNNQPLNYRIYDKFILKILGFSKWLEVFDVASKNQNKSNDQLIKNLKAKFQWVATHAGKLGIPPPPKLTAFKFPSPEKKTSTKKKRRVKVIHEVFVKDIMVVDGMNRKLVPPTRVVGSLGLAECKASARNEGLVGCKASASYEGLAECKASASNLRCIQVRDIIKEVKDYLKTYSSAGMDIN
ncbi:hypothetical protein Tco_0480766 [Tanacetum coccineum]